MYPYRTISWQTLRLSSRNEQALGFQTWAKASSLPCGQAHGAGRLPEHAGHHSLARFLFVSNELLHRSWKYTSESGRAPVLGFTGITPSSFWETFERSAYLLCTHTRQVYFSINLEPWREKLLLPYKRLNGGLRKCRQYLQRFWGICILLLDH